MKDSSTPRGRRSISSADPKQFDYLNFFYGIGAAVVLLAAMFKFSGVEYADTIFLTGICVEVLVFLVSAFRYKEEDYRWERVFPDLLKDGGATEVSIPKFLSAMESLGDISITSGQLAGTLQKVNYSIDKLAITHDDMHSVTSAYLEELEKLKQRVKKMNEKADELSRASF
jgi:hypothetical protein